MLQITLAEAQQHLPEIISGLQPGEAVQIIQGDLPMVNDQPVVIAQLILDGQQPAAIHHPTQRQPRKPGSEIGSLTILAEDQAHLEGFKEYMP